MMYTITLLLAVYKIRVFKLVSVLGRKLCKDFMIVTDQDRKCSMSDEVHFQRSDLANKLNMRYWNEDNPKELH